MRLLSLFVFLFLSLAATAQLDQGLSAYYRFESNLGDASGEPTNLGSAEGVVDYACGVIGESLLLTGPNDFVRIPGGASNNVNREFDDEDFSISLYFKPLTDGGGERYLLSKQDTSCITGRAGFTVVYDPGSRQVTVTLRQDDSLSTTLVHTIASSSCWQQLVVVRELTRLRLYVNGVEVASANSTQRINVDNAGDLLIGAADCPAPGITTFSGVIDELRIYGRPLPAADVRALYLFPDRILTPDQNVFLGQGVEVALNSNCGTIFDWTPVGPVVAADEPEPTITPTQPGIRSFVVSIADDISSCVATDTLTLRVIDPTDLDCGQVFLPRAFTPNGIGPVENETFGIANPFAIGDLVTFEIYDRYGGQVFRTDDQFAQWDGTFRGEPVNPGVMFWRVVYRCEGEELNLSGTVRVLR